MAVPASVFPDCSTATNQRESTSPNALRVLVVDDDPGVRHVIDRVLTRNGYNVLAASSALDAGSLLLEFAGAPDVAVLDIMLPDMRGLVLATYLREQFPGIRFVFITGWLDEAFLQEAKQRGQLLLKPFQGEALLESIARA